MPDTPHEHYWLLADAADLSGQLYRGLLELRAAETQGCRIEHIRFCACGSYQLAISKKKPKEKIR